MLILTNVTEVSSNLLTSFLTQKKTLAVRKVSYRGHFKVVVHC